jgi:flavin-dependent dehydrogenase
VTGARGEVRARVLAVADGAWGRSAEWLKIPAKGASHRRLGLRARCRARRPLDCVEVHVGCGAEVYLTPLPGGAINVAILFTDPPAGLRGAQSLYEYALALYPGLRGRLGSFETPPSCRRLGAPARLPAKDRAFVVGDAAGGVDPILGCGVSIALQSGILAAHAANDILSGADTARVERGYCHAYRRETTSRRRLAAFLRVMSRTRWTARLVVSMGRFLPSWTETMVGIAARCRPLPRSAA